MDQQIWSMDEIDQCADAYCADCILLCDECALRDFLYHLPDIAAELAEEGER